MLETVPWFVGGGAEHSPDVARMLAHVATGGANGITRAGDLKVTELSVPGAFVQVLPGGALLANKYPGGDQQSYVARNITATNVPIEATDSTGGDVKYIIIQIEDPQFDGPVPADPVVGPYVKFAVVPTIDGLNFPHLVLARIDQPASTSTITQSMITDLRKVAQPRVLTAMYTYNLVTPEEDVLNDISNYPEGETWPEATEVAWGQIDIPEWATHMKIKMTWAGVRYPGGDAWGYAWVQVAPTVHPDHFVTQAVTWDSDNNPNIHREVIIAADDKEIPESLRGTAQKIYPRANVNGGSSAAYPKLDSTSAMILEVEFYEKAV